MKTGEEWISKGLPAKNGAEESADDNKRYRRLLRFSILTGALVSLVPLIIMAVVNIYQYQKAYKADIIYPISRQTSNIGNSLESFIEERRSALLLIIKEKPLDEMVNQDNLASLLRHLKESFDGFIDLSIINSSGDQLAYVGPYNLTGKNYRNQDWFHEVSIKGAYVSDVFMGFRGFPHFVIAVVQEKESGDFYVLRATIDSDKLHKEILSQNVPASSDVFLINSEGILQTPSKYHGNIMEKISLPVPAYSTGSEIVELNDTDGTKVILGYDYIAYTPFILMEATNPESIMSNWLSVRNNLLGFLVISIVLIMIVIVWRSKKMVHQVKLSDMKRLRMLHEIGYTNKMASIGRLAAGVAHEINNPLAIINENAGMINDILSVEDSFPKKDKINKYLVSIIRSVDRCSRITHRLLGFAKRMDTQIEKIDLGDLLNEVIGFLHREARNRNVNIDLKSSDDLPYIESDRGQLQQVFLNIINNALDAVKEGETIEVDINRFSDDNVGISVKDHGPGIPKKDLEKIFEPFYTTKKESGTGLGLSITYGIIQKLGGKIDVLSEPGEGTTFIISLPVFYTPKED